MYLNYISTLVSGVIIISYIKGFINLKLNQLSSYSSERVILYRSFYNEVSDEKLREIFSILHSRLNDLFSFMNHKNMPGHGGHYNANESRELIDIIEQLRVIQATLKDEYSFNITEEYEEILRICRSFLSGSGGSSIPDDFPRINIIEDKPIFILSDSTFVNGLVTKSSVTMKIIGEGSYAKVFKYRDPHYGCNFVIKRAKEDLRDDELERFKNEYNDLKNLDSPFIIKAYHYNHDRNEYTMEFADETLGEYINKNNNTLTFNQRRLLIIQLLNAFQYIHDKGLLHRDISYHNILVKQYEDGQLMINVSDFGLVKRPDSNLTRQGTEVKGAINDYSDLIAVGFENYEIRHETYALTQVIYFILTGRQTGYHREKNVALKDFIYRGISSDKKKRFACVAEMKKELITVVFPSICMD